jgi:hypothetical protein
VSSYAIDDGARVLLFDPLAAPNEILELAAGREPMVVLTAPWHERDTQSLVERLGVRVFVSAPDTADDLVRKFGITGEEADGGSPDVAWLLSGVAGEAHLTRRATGFRSGSRPSSGGEHNDLVLWIQGRRAVVLGDTLVDFGRGLDMNEWLRGGVTREQVVERLRPLLDMPVEVVLPAHGAPTDRAALEGALSL